jgi:hypothetical protein
MPAAKQKKNEVAALSSGEEDWVACDSCAGWYRLVGFGESCTLSEAASKKLCCRNCKKLKTLESEVQSLKEMLTKLKKKLTTWSDIVKGVPEIQSLQTEMGKLMEKTKNENILQSVNLSAMQLRQATDESQEVEKRRFNLIVSGLPESGKDSEDDIVELIRYAGKCHTWLTEEDIEEAERLGRPGPSTRLLRLKMRSTQKRMDLLTMRPTDASGTIASTSQVIYIRPDLTKAQMEVDKKLRADLLVAGKDKFMIRRGRIVPRPPSGNLQETTAGLESSNRREQQSGEGSSLEPKISSDKGKSVIPRTYYSSNPKSAPVRQAQTDPLPRSELHTAACPRQPHPNQAVPQSTAPQPGDTAPQPTAPQSTALQPTAPQSAGPQPTAPPPIAPRSTAPQPPAPQSTAPQPTTPQSIAPQPSAPQTTEPQPIAPQSTAPQPTAPLLMAPQPTAPQSSAIQSTAPLSTTPQATSVSSLHASPVRSSQRIASKATKTNMQKDCTPPTAAPGRTPTNSASRGGGRGGRGSRGGGRGGGVAGPTRKSTSPR